MTINNSQKDHDEIIALLPWFVNQTLDEEQASIVSGHLKHCDECQREVGFLGSINGFIQDDAQASYLNDATVDKSLTSVMARIDENESQAKSATTGSSFLQQALNKIIDFCSVLPSGLQGAVAMASVLVAVLGFQFYNGQIDEQFSVLSSSNTSESFIRMSVEVSQSIDHDEVQTTIRSLIDRHGQEISVEKGKNGTYVINVNESMNVDEINALVLDLNDQVSIKRVDILP